MTRKSGLRSITPGILLEKKNLCNSMGAISTPVTKVGLLLQLKS